MDNAQLTKWRTLANDAVIACFGQSTREAQLAEALERAVNELHQYAKCPICGYDNVDEPDWVALTTALEKLGFRLEPL